MSEEQFVVLIERYVRDVAVASTIKNLEKPAGSNPALEHLEASTWYMAQDNASKKIINWIIRRSANHATAGFLSVIDGARSIEDPSPDRGKLELYYVSRFERTYLNDPRTSTLNEVFLA